MQPDVSKFWSKSVENLKVSHLACANGHFNASASRYYYAMRFAVQSLLKHAGIEGEWKTTDGLRVEYWRHDELIEKAGERFNDSIPDIKNMLGLARELREKGDYEPTPVTEPRMRSLRRRAKKVFRKVLNEIR